jgi:hypothetical protein
MKLHAKRTTKRYSIHHTSPEGMKVAAAVEVPAAGVET